MKRFLFAALLISLTVVISACGDGGNGHNKNATPTMESPGASMPNMDHGAHHAGTRELPEGLQAAKNPAFPIGSEVTITADHMPGMKGAQATVTGAFDTVVYTVSYTPTTGGERVTNHKWVIHEELKGSGVKPFVPGSEVTIEADHMPGMKGAKAVIDKAEKTTVYMVDYIPTNGGEKVTNHKWLIGSELEAR